MSFAADIKRIIEQRGQPVTYKRLASVSKNDDTQIRANTYTDYTIKVNVRQYKAQELVGLIIEGDREVRIAAQSISFVPKPQDKVVIDSITFNVVSVNTRTDIGENAVHIIRVRGIQT
jgi:hypothetical protein